MKFKLTKASDSDFESEVEINTLEELLKFIDDTDNIVIYGYECSEINDYKIKIYDDYL